MHATHGIGLAAPQVYHSIALFFTCLNGQTFEEELVGFDAANFMHEYDHLNGVLIVDYLSLEERKALAQLFIQSLNNYS